MKSAKVNTIVAFPTLIHAIEYEECDFVYEYKQLILNDLDHNRLNDRYIWTSEDNLNDRPEYSELVKLIDGEVSNLFQEYGLIKEHFEMSCMWANVHKNGGRHVIHQHPNSFLSGVIYIDVPENDSGKLMFVDPRPAKSMFQPTFTKDSPISDRVINVNPRTGLLVLFPSWLEHGTDYVKLNDNQYRICISFNYVMKRSDLKTARL